MVREHETAEQRSLLCKVWIFRDEKNTLRPPDFTLMLLRLSLVVFLSGQVLLGYTLQAGWSCLLNVSIP